MTTAPVTPLDITIYPPQNLPDAKPAETGGEGFAITFDDFLDTINPLQHIPILSDLYQSISGDVQSVGAELAGSALFGGPLGFIGSLLNNIIESETGDSLSGHVLNLFAQEEASKEAQETSAQKRPFLNANRFHAHNAYVSVQSWNA